MDSPAQTNSTYEDFLGIWDAYNGSDTEAGGAGLPPDWIDFYYWTATPSALGHSTINLNDGLLALDINQDGVINDAIELFGSATRLNGGGIAEDGYQALSQHDDNADGVINELDTVFAGLKLWVDANQDGHTDAGELRALSDFGVSELSLDAQVGEQVDNGNVLGLVSEWKDSSGASHDMADVWFATQSLDALVEQALSSGEAESGVGTADEGVVSEDCVTAPLETVSYDAYLVDVPTADVEMVGQSMTAPVL